MDEITLIHERAKRIVSSDLSWKDKYNMIFSDDVSGKVIHLFDYYDPDSDYDDDVIAFMNGFDEYMIKHNIIITQIDIP
jgi:radical SAM superfamily enzyme YgiQ (UPF0313 family)